MGVEKKLAKKSFFYFSSPVFFVALFDFSSPPPSGPGSPRMVTLLTQACFVQIFSKFFPPFACGAQLRFGPHMNKEKNENNLD